MLPGMEALLDPHRAREARMGARMLRDYCRRHHGPELCESCRDLGRYAEARLRHCVFGADKPTCARCPVHCYAPERRAQIRAVMRSEAPRLLWRHPWMALRHWLDGLRPVPSRPVRPPHDR